LNCSVLFVLISLLLALEWW